MLALSTHVAAAIRGYLAFYMPTNRVIDWLRSPRGRKWAIPAACVATPAYLCRRPHSVCARSVQPEQHIDQHAAAASA